MNWADFVSPPINLWNYPKQNEDYKMSDLEDTNLSSHYETIVKPVWKIKESPATPDLINNPAHYKKGGFEVWDIIEAFGLNYNIGNVTKYILRAGHKGNKLDDLKKASAYLNREIEKIEGKK